MSFPHTQVGVFEMAKNGMVAVENPSQLFLDMREEERNGFSGAIAVTMEGSRPFLVEIQVNLFLVSMLSYLSCKVSKLFFLYVIVSTSSQTISLSL